MKRGVNIMPLQVTPPLYLFISYQQYTKMADLRTSEVGMTIST